MEPPPLAHEQVLLLGGVAAGELARRFLLIVGATGAPASGDTAAAWAAAERLRGLSKVPTAAGAARDALVVSLHAFRGGHFLLTWACAFTRFINLPRPAA